MVLSKWYLYPIWLGLKRLSWSASKLHDRFFETFAVRLSWRSDECSLNADQLIQRQPATILETSEFRRLLKECQGRFDFIVIDSPNLSRYNDAFLLESFSDGILMVVRPRQTQKELLKQSLSLLAEAQIPFLGTVINAAFNVTGNALSTGEETEESDRDLLGRGLST